MGEWTASCSFRRLLGNIRHGANTFYEEVEICSCLGLVTVWQPSLHWRGSDRGIEVQQVDLVGSLGLVLLITALTVLGYRINHVV